MAQHAEVAAEGSVAGGIGGTEDADDALA